MDCKQQPVSHATDGELVVARGDRHDDIPAALEAAQIVFEVLPKFSGKPNLSTLPFDSILNQNKNNKDAFLLVRFATPYTQTHTT